MIRDLLVLIPLDLHLGWMGCDREAWRLGLRRGLLLSWGRINARKGNVGILGKPLVCLEFLSFLNLDEVSLN